MKTFLSIKFHADHRNRERIEAISIALSKRELKAICIARDVEEWGRLHFDTAELMRRTFTEIDASDLVIVDLTEKGVGVGIEAGYARAKQIPIVVIAQTGSEISETLRGIARSVIVYDDLRQLDGALTGVENYVK